MYRGVLGLLTGSKPVKVAFVDEWLGTMTACPLAASIRSSDSSPAAVLVYNCIVAISRGKKLFRNGYVSKLFLCSSILAWLCALHVVRLPVGIYIRLAVTIHPTTCMTVRLNITTILNA
jgi:hypothetical protein